MKHIYGTWIQVNDSSLSIPKTKRELSFTEDGKYTVKYYKNKHVVDSLKGTFELDLEKNRIDLADVYPKLKDMTVIKLTETEMRVEIADDLSAHFTSDYRRQ